ncbi:MAG TPA: YbaK/EbsC family protein [Anaerohalosphaeraceae bacterium]|nr:YbaK/EbsC family protein [Anaerohalosphaeraceae bacterium]
MRAIEYLNEQKCRYEMVHHKPVYTAEQLARTKSIPSRQVAKSVTVEADGRFYLCVLPADRKIDFITLRKRLKVKQAALATEAQMAGLFEDCQVGAMAPIGNVYNLPTLMDKTLTKDKEITFLAGTHETSIRMSTEEYIRLVRPTILKFSYSVWPRRIVDPFYFDPFVDIPFGM